jgi:hypothetical protein
MSGPYAAVAVKASEKNTLGNPAGWSRGRLDPVVRGAA